MWTPVSAPTKFEADKLHNKQTKKFCFFLPPDHLTFHPSHDRLTTRSSVTWGKPYDKGWNVTFQDYRVLEVNFYFNKTRAYLNIFPINTFHVCAPAPAVWRWEALKTRLLRWEELLIASPVIVLLAIVLSPWQTLNR